MENANTELNTVIDEIDAFIRKFLVLTGRFPGATGVGTDPRGDRSVAGGWQVAKQSERSSRVLATGGGVSLFASIPRVARPR
jgi:hypothetical protein